MGKKEDALHLFQAMIDSYEELYPGASEIESILIFRDLISDWEKDYLMAQKKLFNGAVNYLKEGIKV